jgi:large subunit ribosomal protein L9
MPKTEVILTHNVVGLGGESDHVKVAAGYARNFLFPQGLAIPLTAANKRRLEVLRQRRAERESKELSSMTELGQALSKLTLVIQVKTGEDGKLFGSITAGTIADELKHQYDAIVDKRKIHLVHPIKNVGEHEVELRLHGQVQSTLKVRVESTTPAPQPEAQAPETRDQGRAGREGRRDQGRQPAARREEPKPEAKAEAKPDRKGRAAKPE